MITVNITNARQELFKIASSCIKFNDVVNISTKEGNVKWMTLEEMKKGKMVEHMDKMIEVFVDDNLSEFYYQKTESGYKIELK